MPGQGLCLHNVHKPHVSLIIVLAQPVSILGSTEQTDAKTIMVGHSNGIHNK